MLFKTYSSDYKYHILLFAFNTKNSQNKKIFTNLLCNADKINTPMDYMKFKQNKNTNKCSINIDKYIQETRQLIDDLKIMSSPVVVFPDKSIFIGAYFLEQLEQLNNP